jgi:hypothetical protein
MFPPSIQESSPGLAVFSRWVACSSQVNVRLIPPSRAVANPWSSHTKSSIGFSEECQRKSREPTEHGQESSSYSAANWDRFSAMSFLMLSATPLAPGGNRQNFHDFWFSSSDLSRSSIWRANPSF